ncbi:MAG TPA: AsmA-like C-terminal region-containing protein, partial [Saprospiraceae bacterium]|nr:AsmA-like C-terminal region-containing protein [Saprospiraceae bacterium]
DGKLGTDMTPHFSSLNASGFIETISSVMSELKILDVLSDKLGLDNLKNINLDNTKNWFEIKQGYVELKEKLFEVKDIGIKISGKHQIQGQMEYVMVLKVPRALLQKNKVTAAADKGWSWVESEAGKRGLNLNQGAFIDFRVDIGGFLKNPSIKITPVGSSGKSIQDEIKDEVQNEINNLVDSVKNVANEKKEQLKDTLMTRAEQEIEKAKDKIKDEVNAKGDEIADKAKEIITKEVETKLDSTLGPGVTDSLKKRAEQILKEKTGTEVDDIKKKLDDFNPFKKKKP